MSATEFPSGADAVLGLADIDATMTDLVGGKAANLGELIGVGAKVPPGFCVTTDAYEQVCRPLTTDLLGRLDSDPAIAGEVRTRLTDAPFPSALAEAITRAYAELGPDVPVAVRSSATAEDLPHASFAGQQDTYLNIIGPRALLDAVARCWGSLWTDRAVAYRTANGIDHGAVRLAVVVQRMVDAASSGVLFTANSITGRRDQAVIDANSGLGESVVSGAVDPDQLIVETATGEITSRKLGGRQLSVRAKPGGGVESVARTDDGEPSLTDDQARALALLGAGIERHYAKPQDIEWAIDADGQLWVTQSRAITTLFPLPERERDGLRVYFSFNVAQGVFRPLTPMGYSVIRLFMTGMMRNLGITARPPVVQVAGWLFLDITGALHNPLGRRILPQVMAMMEARSGKVITRLLADPRLSRRNPVRPLLVRIGALLARTKLPIAAARMLRRPEQAREEAFGTAEALRADFARSSAASPHERLAAVRAGEISTTRRMVGLIPKIFPVLLLSRMLPLILGKSVSAEEVQIILRGLPNNVTTEMDLDLWRLAGEAGEDPESARAFAELSASELAERYRDGTLPITVLNGLKAFLDRNGHRAIAEIDAGMPRWSEDPSHLLDVIANYIRTARGGHAADEQYRRGADEAEAMLDRVVARLRRRNPLRARLAAFATHRVRNLGGLREMPKYCLVLYIDHARRQLRAAGSELVDAGRLDTADDIFFLDLAEAAEAVGGTDHRALVAERRETYDREVRRKHIPRLLLSDGTEPEATLPVDTVEGMLSGSSASAGTVTGTAKVVLDPAGARIEPGEILVAPSTDPGWTPLFLTAGGLVMEMGGPNSHGATVAREYGIPAVVGVPDATKRITNGQRITINGSAGTVELD